MRQTTLQLTDPDRQALKGFRAKGTQPVRSVNRAHILSALDRKVSEQEILRVLGVGRTALWRTRAAYLEHGLTYALKDLPRPGRPVKYAAKPAAEVCALACTHPPPAPSVGRLSCWRRKGKAGRTSRASVGKRYASF